MLPSFAGLDLRRRTAPTDAVLGQRALERRIGHFESVFTHRVAEAPLSASEDGLLHSELQSIYATLIAKGPAELALLDAANRAPRDGGVDSHLVHDAQAEWAEQEQALHVLREMWNVRAVRSHLARKMIECGVLKAIVLLLPERLFAHDLRSEALLSLHQFASAATGNVLVQWHLLMSDAQTNALVPLVCSFVNTNPATSADQSDTRCAMGLLSAFVDGDRGFHDVELYKLHDTEGRNGDFQPAERARKALTNIDGAIEKVLAASEMVVTRQHLPRPITMAVSSTAISVLNWLMWNDAQPAKEFAERNGLERIMQVFYSIAHSNEMRSEILNVVRAFVHQTSKPSDWKAGAQVQVLAVLPPLFLHWYGGVGVQLPAERTGEEELWHLMRELADIRELKNVLLESDDCYHLLLACSDYVGAGEDHPRLPEVYHLLARVLTEPTTPVMWSRFTERGPGDRYWAETIIDDIARYVREGRIDEIPDYKLATVAQMMQEQDLFLKVCVVRVSETTMVELLQPYIHQLYKSQKGPEDRWLDALKALATNGRLWEAIAKTIEKEEDDDKMGYGSWKLVVEALHDDDVLAKAACSDPWPSPMAALVLLHKLNEAHAELLLAWRPLPTKERAQLKERQEQYEPVLDAILKTRELGGYWNGAFVEKAVAFARQLLWFPSLDNPHQDALRDEYNEYNHHNKRGRYGGTAGEATSTNASASSGAAFVSLLAFLSP